MCFHPHSDVTLPIMKTAGVVAVIDRWAKINQELGGKYAWVQVNSSCSKHNALLNDMRKMLVNLSHDHLLFVDF